MQIKKIYQIPKGFGVRLKEERARLGLSQVALANITDSSRRSMIAYELESTSPSVEWLARFAQAGADLDFLLYAIRSSATPVEFCEKEFIQALRWADENCRDVRGKPMSIDVRINNTLCAYRLLVGSKGLSPKLGAKELVKLFDSVDTRSA